MSGSDDDCSSKTQQRKSRNKRVSYVYSVCSYIKVTDCRR